MTYKQRGSIVCCPVAYVKVSKNKFVQWLLFFQFDTAVICKFQDIDSWQKRSNLLFLHTFFHLELHHRLSLEIINGTAGIVECCVLYINEYMIAGRGGVDTHIAG